MKKIFLAVLLFAHGASYAQNATTNVAEWDIIYNYADGKFEPGNGIPLHVREGSIVTIQYKQVNPFSLSNAPTFTDINHTYTDGLSTAQTGLNNIEQATAAPAVPAAAAPAAVADSTAHPQQFLLARQTANNYANTKAVTLGNIRAAFQAIQTDIYNIQGIMTLDTLMTLAKNDLQNTEAEKMAAAIYTPVHVYHVTDADDIATAFNTDLTDIRTQMGNIATGIGQVKANEALLPAGTVSTVPALIDSLHKRMAALNNAYSGDNLKILQTNISVLSYNGQAIAVTSYQIKPKVLGTASGDFIQVADVLKDGKGNTVCTLSPHSIPTTGGSRVDFSVGLSANVWGNGYEYTLQKNPYDSTTGPDTAMVRLYKSQKNKIIQFNPVIQIHWYRTTTKTVQWMLTLGLAPDFSTLANSRIFLGTSLGFPSSNDLTKRLVVSLGLSVGYADVLKPEYEGYTDYARFGTVADSDLTEKALRPGAFLSVSYNLGGTGHSSATSNTTTTP